MEFDFGPEAIGNHVSFSFSFSLPLSGSLSYALSCFSISSHYWRAHPLGPLPVIHSLGHTQPRNPKSVKFQTGCIAASTVKKLSGGSIFVIVWVSVTLLCFLSPPLSRFLSQNWVLLSLIRLRTSVFILLTMHICSFVVLACAYCGFGITYNSLVKREK